MTREHTGDPRIVDIVDLWTTISSRIWIPAATAVALGVVAVVGAYLQTPVYRGETTVMVVESENSMTTGEIAGFPSMLAGLTGLSANATRIHEILAILNARSFLTRFVTRNGLVDEIAAGLDMDCERDAEECIQNVVGFLREEAITIDSSPATGLLTISVHWIEASAAAAWANLLVDELNTVLRERDLREAEVSIAYLTETSSATTLNEVRAAVFALLEKEHRTMMLVNAREEYALRFIDRAVTPLRPTFPRKPLYLAIGVVLGGLLGLLYLLIHAGRPRER